MRKNRGFTIIELLVALTIVAIITALAVASYTYATPCSTMATGYLQGSFPAETLVGWNAYAQNCTATTYCVCARLEGGGGGNASNSTCTFGTGEYFCVANQQ